MPYNLKKHFFSDKEEPDLLTEYDALGFVAEHALVAFNMEELTKLIVTTHLEELHARWPGSYPK